MHKTIIGDSVVYLFDNGKMFIDNITLTHLDFHMYNAIGTSTAIDKLMFYKDCVPIVGRPFCCFLNKDSHIDFWEYLES